MDVTFKETILGKIPSNWDLKTVHELVVEGYIHKPLDGNHGNIHPKGNDFVEEGIPFIMASDLSNGNVDTKTCKFISQEQAGNLQKGFSYPGDVLITHKATMGRTALVKDLPTEYIMLTPQVTYYRVKNKEKLDNKYLKLFFDSKPFQRIFNSWSESGSTRSYLGITAQRELPIIIPPIEVQKNLVKILFDLDDKIEMNRKMNQTLEKTAKAIYKQWFEDFEFPNSNGKAYKSFGGAIKNEIPKNWRIDTLENVLELIIDHRGKTPTKLGGNWSTEKGIPAISAKNIKNGKLIRKSSMGHINNDLYDKWMKVKLEPSDILLTSEAPLGEMYFLAEKEDFCLSQRLFGLRPKNGISSTYLYYYLRSNKGQSELERRSTGTTVVGIRQSELRTIPITIPDPGVMKEANDLFITFEKTIYKNDKEIDYLIQLRNTLLPELISGRLML